jgi:indolepyruvate ferredoxin oxidoreductase
VVGSKKVLGAIKPGNTRVIVNTAEFLPGDFTRNADYSLPTERLKRAIVGSAGAARSNFIDASRLATALLGNSIGGNMFMLGYAYQVGALPLSAEAVEKAIEMNGEAVQMNIAAFRYGRRAVVDPAAVEALVAPRPQEDNDSLRLSQTFAETVERRVTFLTGYQSKHYARRYRRFVDKVQAAEAQKAPGMGGLAEGVARYLFKLMAYKDEYEVARLYTDTSFVERVRSSFGGDNLRLEFHLAPPMLARRDAVTGEAKKMSFGPWLLKAFAVLAKFKFLRGTPLDPFGYTAERRTERQLVSEYMAGLEEIIEHLTPSNHGVAVALAVLPEKIRGFGHVKARHLVAAKAEEAVLREQFRSGSAQFLKAAE